MRRPPRPYRPHGPGMAGMGPRGPPPMRPRGPPPGLARPLMPGLRPHHPVMGPVTSCTNSTDPSSMDSRLFVGNLNTLALKKEAIEAIFAHYGLILGISMHKGYAFVQFNHPDEARHAGANEDGKIYAGQAIDINIVSQPKNRNALKRPSGGKPVVDAPAKKICPETAGSNQSLQRTLVTLSGSADSSKATQRLGANNSQKRATATATRKPGTPAQNSDTDILICGTCKLQFTGLHILVSHKKLRCQLRVSTAVEVGPTGDNDGAEPSALLCATCETQFTSAWALCQHCTEEHQLTIYKVPKTELSDPADVDNGDKS